MKINCNEPENVEKVIEVYKKYRRKIYRRFSFFWCTVVSPLIVFVAVPLFTVYILKSLVVAHIDLPICIGIFLFMGLGIFSLINGSIASAHFELEE